MDVDGEQVAQRRVAGRACRIDCRQHRVLVRSVAHTLCQAVHAQLPRSRPQPRLPRLRSATHLLVDSQKLLSRCASVNYLVSNHAPAKATLHLDLCRVSNLQVMGSKVCGGADWHVQKGKTIWQCQDSVKVQQKERSAGAAHLFEGHVSGREEEQGDFGDAQGGAALGSFAKLPRGRRTRRPPHEAAAKAQQPPPWGGLRLRLLQRAGRRAPRGPAAALAHHTPLQLLALRPRTLRKTTCTSTSTFEKKLMKVGFLRASLSPAVRECSPGADCQACTRLS